MVWKDLPIVLKVFFSFVIITIGYLAIFKLTILGAKLINDPLDREILLALQPDKYIPVVDEFIIFLTHFSTYLFSITTLSWLATYLIVRRSDKLAQIASFVWKCLAVVLLVYHLCGMWIHSQGIFWWREHQYKTVFVFLGVVSFVVFWSASYTWIKWDYPTREKWVRVLLVTIVSVFYTNYLGEDNIKKIVGRPRPLNDANKTWNDRLRVIPDEVVKFSPSYISGHASSLFALLTPAIWATRKKWVKLALLCWALLHAYTRIYTAAHFPYCTLMGGIFGFLIGTLVYYSFWWYINPNSALKLPNSSERAESH
ncbi:MAG: phosphatase PAP2 family protein [Candidatus Hydrogenedentes bacterium]|nr:phosphatase PAP2 family protein [Candidatus Hydrogenedentota bacterium]